MEPAVWWGCTDDAEAQRLLASLRDLYPLDSPPATMPATMPATRPAMTSAAKQLATALHADPPPPEQGRGRPICAP